MSEVAGDLLATLSAVSGLVVIIVAVINESLSFWPV